MTEELLHRISAEYPLTELDAGEYRTLRASGMRFGIRCYDARGLGTVSLMTASGFFGLMKMDTLIVSPTQIDMPLLSYDRVLAAGNDTLIFELYDTLIGDAVLPETQKAKQEGANLPQHDLGAHWYDSIKRSESVAKKSKKKDTPALDLLANHYMDAFLRDCRQAESADPAVKRGKVSEYVEGLLRNGGPSTDVFKKAIGEERTGILFRTILFGCEP